MRFKEYKTIIFDIDNTLISYEKTEQNAFEKTMDEFGIPHDEDLLHQFQIVCNQEWNRLDMEKSCSSYIQENYHSLYYQFVKNRFMAWKKYINTDVEADALSEHFLHYFCTEESFIGNIKEVLRMLSKDTELLIGSNGLTYIQKPRISEIESYFQKVYISEDVKWIKPDSRFFEYILKDRGITDPKSVLMVGDSLQNDILGASLAGIDTCWVNPKHKEKTLGVIPRFEVERAEEIGE